MGENTFNDISGTLKDFEMKFSHILSNYNIVSQYTRKKIETISNFFLFCNLKSFLIKLLFGDTFGWFLRMEKSPITPDLTIMLLKERSIKEYLRLKTANLSPKTKCSYNIK